MTVVLIQCRTRDHNDIDRRTPLKEIMISNTSAEDREKSPSKRYWISTYVLYFIATFLIYLFVGIYFNNKIDLNDILVSSFITHNVFYYLIVYREKRSQS